MADRAEAVLGAGDGSATGSKKVRPRFSDAVLPAAGRDPGRLWQPGGRGRRREGWSAGRGPDAMSWAGEAGSLRVVVDRGIGPGVWSVGWRPSGISTGSSAGVLRVVGMPRRTVR